VGGRYVYGMNIILFSNRRGQIWNVELSPVLLGVLTAGVLLILCGALLYAGTRPAARETTRLDEWQAAVQAQQAAVARAKDSAQAQLEALTLRVGRIQAQLMRLNALGKRLVSQADIDAAEFDFDTIPPLGGPQDTVEATEVPDFLAMLDEVTGELDDREQKLGVLERLLMEQSLRERVIPSGRPVSKGWMSSRFGKRADPFSGKQEYHRGVDFAGKAGADVLSVGDGVVTWSGKRSGYGNLVEINHGNGYITRYGHNRENLVKPGDMVEKGQRVALMGSTGRSTGPHVHFEVLRNGKRIDPSRYIRD